MATTGRSAEWRAAGWIAFSMKNKGNWSSKCLFPIKLLFGLGIIAALFSSNHSHLLAFADPFLLAPALPASRKWCSAAGFLANLIVYNRRDTELSTPTQWRVVSSLYSNTPDRRWDNLYQ